MCECLCAGVGCCLCGCCSETADSCRRGLGRQRVTKICYLFIVVIFTVPAIAILFFINKWDGFKSHFDWMSCPKSTGGGQFECIGSSTIFRISISFLCLFGLMLVFMLFRARLLLRQVSLRPGHLHRLLVRPQPKFPGLRRGQQVYLYHLHDHTSTFNTIKSIILIDLFYLAGIKLVARYDEGESSCAAALIFLTLLFQGLAVFLNVLGYVYFATSDLCGNSLWVNIITTIIIVALPFLQLLHFNKQNSLVTTALVSLYISYLAFVGQFSYGGDSCTGRMTTGSIAFDILVSTGIFMLAMYGSIMGGSGQVRYSETGDVNKAMGVAPTQPTQPQEEIQPKYVQKQQSAEKLDDPESDAGAMTQYVQSFSWVKWHFYMCIASIYIGMLVTNWTSASPTTGDLTSNGFGFWVRIAVSWLTTLIYIWTLLAPKVFPERDFAVV